MTEKLLPCPFCGGEAETFEASEDSFSILCTGCGVETPYLPYLTEAIAAWNRRAQPENKPLTLDELREMDGEPAWIDAHREWFIVYIAHPDFGDCVVARAGTYLPIELAAKRRPYRSKPEVCIGVDLASGQDFTAYYKPVEVQHE